MAPPSKDSPTSSTFPITLALSLHAPNDDLPPRAHPWSEFTTIDQLLAA
ncbi:MAG: hypothetical protein R3B49_10195 [Phycisphaerales bacterium]